MEDLVSTEDNVEWAVNRIRKYQSRVPSGMREEHLKGWLVAARKEGAATAKATAAEGAVEVIGGPGGEETEENRETKTEAMTHWEKVVDLVRADFGEGRMAEEATWQAAVLIPKGKGYYRGIGLVEMV